VADWGDGVSASCTVGPVVCYHEQWMATYCAAVPLAHVDVPLRNYSLTHASNAQNAQSIRRETS